MEKLILLITTLAVLAWSGVEPVDRLTWVFEVLPVLIGLAIILPTHHSFPLSMLLYRLLFIHGVILMVGGHYTYAEVPLGNWVQDAFGLMRNHYDRLGHFAQGFIPAILAREILLRKTPLAHDGWLSVLSISICLAFSAFYELLEWWAALILGEGADSVLATQGDQWDTQWDMFLALLGAMVSMIFLRGLHDRSLSRPDL